MNRDKKEYVTKKEFEDTIRKLKRKKTNISVIIDNGIVKVGDKVIAKIEPEKITDYVYELNNNGSYKSIIYPDKTYEPADFEVNKKYFCLLLDDDGDYFTSVDSIAITQCQQ